jgi:enoyl-CoA hydratase
MDAQMTTERRDFLAAALGGLAGLSALNTTVVRADESNPGAGSSSEETIMSDIPLSPNAKITLERRGAIALIGINRSYIHNRIDPEAFVGLARAYYDYDMILRCALQSCSVTVTIFREGSMSSVSESSSKPASPGSTAKD